MYDTSLQRQIPSFATGNNIHILFMETIYLCIIIFLFVLAVFDLIVGVSNDAVNFLNSAVGAKAASFKTILFIAGIGIFIGASLSNGMMDIARHGIYQPEHFYFAEIMCIRWYCFRVSYQRPGWHKRYRNQQGRCNSSGKNHR